MLKPSHSAPHWRKAYIGRTSKVAAKGRNRLGNIKHVAPLMRVYFSYIS
jgi:hypothetical protein